MSSAITQLSCFFSLNNNRRFLTRSYPFSTNFRPIKILNIASGDGITNLENSKTSASYKEDASTIHNGNSIKSNPIVENFAVDGLTEKQVVSQPKKGAKIHDFCFGIPFGGIVLSGGLLGFVFSRNPATLGTGVLFGGALLALSTFSLKIWRQGKSSLPFILGQAVLSVALLSKNLKNYSLTQKLFPTGFNVFISAAMFCFYCYVVISGGNPPPKKKTQTAAAAATS